MLQQKDTHNDKSKMSKSPMKTSFKNKQTKSLKFLQTYSFPAHTYISALTACKKTLKTLDFILMNLNF